MAKSTPDQFEMFAPMTCEGSSSVIGSLASLAGRAPCVLPAGPTTENAGPAVRPASPSASPAKAKATRTSATSGPLSFGSSESVALQRSLESRLRARLDTDGSIECVLTWKAKRTPSGRRYCQLVPSARLTDGIGSGLWPTPSSQITGDTPETHEARQVRVVAKHGRRMGTPLAIHAMHAQAGTTISALWPTPCAQDGPNGGPSQGLERLPGMAAHSLWPTPLGRDGQGGPRYDPDGKSAGLVAIRGAILSGSPAQTAKPGALAPEFVAWMMGLPPGWLECAPTTKKK